MSKDQKVDKGSKLVINIDSINEGQLLPQISDKPDHLTTGGMESLRADYLKERLRSRTQDRQMRKGYALKIYKLVKWWLGGLLTVLMLAGFGKACGFFILDSDVLSVLAGGTTAGVVGLFAFVAKYLFKDDANSK